jgi:ABC-type multidrug transport system fused ATPase/permease subunit
VRDAIRKLADKAVIAVAHRLSTIEYADMIYVLENGRIIEAGKHNELASAGGLYSRLYQLQYC